MESWIRFGEVSKEVRAGDVGIGEVVVINQRDAHNCRLDIVLKGREAVQIRKFDEKLMKIENVEKKQKVCDENMTFTWNHLSASTHSTKFEFKTKKEFPGTTEIVHFHDSAKVYYKVKAILYIENAIVSKASMPITLIPHSLSSKTNSYQLNFKKCCCSYGQVEVISELSDISFSVQSVINANLMIDNVKGKGSINRATIEIWKKVAIKTKEDFEKITELVSRDNEEVTFAIGESLLAEGNIRLNIDLSKFSKKIGNSYSANGEIVLCEYSLKVMLTMRTFLGAVSNQINIPIIIHA